MDKPTCPRCNRRPVVAKGLCRVCYYTTRVSAARSAEHAQVRTCPVDGTEFAGRDRRAVYCSLKCKDRAQNETRQARKEAARPDRICALCGKPIPKEGRPAKVPFCSSACTQRGRNIKKAQADRELRHATTTPCAVCAGPIGMDRRANAKTCSKACERELVARWRQANTPAYMRQYKYGITAEQFAARLEAQGDRCAICRSDAPSGKGGWHVDHDHATNAIRGLLCHNCNLMLGNAKDDPARLRAAAAYLE